MANWWNELVLMKQVFYTIAIPATIILLIQSILSIIGLSDIDSDFDVDTDIGDGFDGFDDFDNVQEINLDDMDTMESTFLGDFRFFTIRGLIAFFSIFGWTGAVLMNKYSNLVAIVGGFVAGIFAMFLIGYLFYGMTKLQADGSVNYTSSLGSLGEVYLTIPPNRQGKGKVMIKIQNRLVECNAITKGDVTIKTGESIQVVGVLSDHTLIVEKL